MLLELGESNDLIRVRLIKSLTLLHRPAQCHSCICWGLLNQSLDSSNSSGLLSHYFAVSKYAFIFCETLVRFVIMSSRTNYRRRLSVLYKKGNPPVITKFHSNHAFKN
uniref:Uncharacterized protein n=1 Tax=Glossina austeni TaxID=7395 RepID=A0A1A9VGB1_GLOAU